MMNKVFLVSPTESLITQRGKRHPNLTNLLNKKGIIVDYITSTINHSEKRLFTKEEIIEGINEADYKITFLNCGLYKKNITVRRLLWNQVFASKVFWHLFKYSHKNDIIILPSRPPELLFVGWFIKLIKRTKLFIDIEDIWPDAFMIKNIIIKKGFYFYCNLLNKLSIPSFDAGVHVSPNFQDWLKRYRPKFSSELATLGINSIEINQEYRKYYSEELDKLNLFYGGTLTLQFDILPILKAIKKSNRSISITLAGDNGTGERFERIISFLNENDIEYINLGVLNKSEFLKHLGKSDVAIIPMISGGLPKKFFDAIGCFKPIICLGVGGVSAEVNKHNIGWTADFDVNQVLDILSVINKDSLNEKINNVSLNINRYLESNSLNIIYKELQKLF